MKTNQQKRFYIILTYFEWISTAISDADYEITKPSDNPFISLGFIEKFNKKMTGVSYDSFYEILKKLDFGNPFVEHVAKKTYIKTKSNHSSINDDVSPDIFELDDNDN